MSNNISLLMPFVTIPYNQPLFLSHSMFDIRGGKMKKIEHTKEEIEDALLVLTVNAYFNDIFYYGYQRY